MSNFNSPEHAIVAGALIGILMSSEERLAQVFGNEAVIRPIVDAESNYTPVTVIAMKGDSGKEYTFTITVEETTESPDA